jgi:glycosyltransferase involved in cell wall biosynthesis
VNSPEFTVVIPAFNAREVIGSAIGSVLKQTWEDFELVVVDDGSSDETPEIVEAVEDSRVHLVRQANTGTAGARNTGIERSKGDFVSFLDNDDLWMPDYLETMREALIAEPAAGLAYTDGWVLDDLLHRIRRKTAMSSGRPPDQPPPEAPDFLVELMHRNFILSSATVRKSVLDEIGGFREGLGGCDDYDLWIRIVAAGYPAVRASGLLTIQRDRADSQSKDATVMLRGLERVLVDALEEERLSPEAKVAAQAQLAEVRPELAEVSGSGIRAASHRLRARLVPLTKRLRQRRNTYAEPPPPVARAFPDLEDL